MLDRSFDSATPRMVAVSAIYLIVFGIVIVVVVCRVEILVSVPTIIDVNISRISGLIMAVVSFGLWRVRGNPVIVSRIICVL